MTRDHRRQGHGPPISWPTAADEVFGTDSFVLYIIAGVLITTRPEAAAIIQGAAEAYVAASVGKFQPISSALTAALGDEHARELRARGADMDWDQALAYTLTQTTQALSELESGTQL